MSAVPVAGAAALERVLVVERRREVEPLLRDRRGGPRQVVWAPTAVAALTEVRRHRPQAVLLGLDLPDLDGVQLCRTLRNRYPDLTLIIVSDRRRPVEAVLGLDAGADDYLVRPFSGEELLARVLARVLSRGRASARPTGRTGGADGPERLVCGSLVLEPGSRRVLLGGQEIPLRRKEFDLLARLAGSAGRAVPRTTLMNDVWDRNWFGSTKTLDVTMATLRRKLGQAATATGAPMPTITTLRGHGYRFERPARPA
jgi:DNA-binding response OmpR family regulator